MAKYYAVIDAGSTNSGLYLFDIYGNDKEVKFKTIPLKKNHRPPGLAHVLPEEMETYFLPLIESLRAGIPEGLKESDIDLYLLATGDMRAVSPFTQEKIFHVIKKYLVKNTKLNVKCAETMPEEMEGVFDWICINTLTEKLGSDSNYGVIDIGGATIQVAYAVDNLSEKNTKEVKIGDYTYFVHSRSYLGIGNDQTREQFLDNPDCIPKNLALVTTTGNGNFAACLKAVKSFLISVHNVESIPPDILKKTKFVGFAYFSYLIDSPPFLLGKEASINEIKSKAEAFAKLSWEEMVAKWPNDKYLHAYYLGSALTIDLLEILGFSPDTKITTERLYAGIGDSWAIGAAVYFYYGNKLDETLLN